MLRKPTIKIPETPEVLDVNMTSLNSMIAYCENEADCRRSLMLSHFGGSFYLQL